MSRYGGQGRQSPKRATAIKKPKIAESDFQQGVIDLARLTGWLVYHTHDSRHSAGGFPDLVLVRSQAKPMPRKVLREGRIIFAELKSETGQLSDDQVTWLTALEHAAHLIGSSSQGDVKTRVEVYTWKPSDMPEIENVLRRPKR